MNNIFKRIEHINSLLPEEEKHYDITINVVGSRKISENFARMYTDEVVVEQHGNATIRTKFIDTGKELSAGSSGNNK